MFEPIGSATVRVWNKTKNEDTSIDQVWYTGAYDDHVQMSGTVNGRHQIVQLPWELIEELYRLKGEYAKAHSDSRA
jgi:hypothetical protein